MSVNLVLTKIKGEYFSRLLAKSFACDFIIFVIFVEIKTMGIVPWWFKKKKEKKEKKTEKEEE